MGTIIAVIEFLKKNWTEIAQVIVAVIGAASIIVKLTPTLKDDNVWLPIVKFLGKYIALNRSGDEAKRAIIK